MGRYPSFFTCVRTHKSVSVILLAVTIWAQFTFLEFLLPNFAEAAVVTIDTNVSPTATEHLVAGSQTIFTTDQNGYKFYVDSTGSCVYSKTTNGGNSWGAAVTVDAQTGDLNEYSIEEAPKWIDRIQRQTFSICVGQKHH